MKRSGFKVMARLSGLVKPLAGYMTAAVTMGLLGHLCASFITICGVMAVADILGFPAPFSKPVFFILMAVFSVLRGVLRYGEQGCNHFIAFKLLAIIRDKVFAALRKLCPAKLEVRDKGNLISIITSDVELLEVFYAHTISPILIATLFSAIMCLFIGSYSYILGLLALAAYLTIGVLVPIVVSKKSGDRGLRFREKSGNLSGFVLDSLRGLSETIQYAGGQQRLDEITKQSTALADEQDTLSRKAARGTGAAGMIIMIFDLAMLFTASALYSRGEIGFNGVLISTAALMSSFGPVISLANLGSGLQLTFAAGNRILDILDDVPVTEDITGEEKTTFAGAEVKNLNFAYDSEEILSDLSLSIPHDKVTGIVGKSGSGKSTLLKLLMRFWQADSGEVLISGRNINKVNTEDLRNMESFVTQETELFHDSILNNLLLAKPDATREQVEEACKKASVHDFIVSLPDGYDSNIGELGDTLSGGERQRIGLARAFLHDGDLMLLDEPTSNLDSLNEAVILKSLHRQANDRTVVLVSHRKSTMGIADRVYSVENGRLS